MDFTICIVTIIVLIVFMWELRKTRQFLHSEICSRIEELKQDIFSPLVEMEHFCDDDDEDDDMDYETAVNKLATAAGHVNMTCDICQHEQCVTCSGTECVKCGVEITAKID